MSRSTAALLLAFCCSGAASADSWPDNMSTLLPGPSVFPYAAVPDGHTAIVGSTASVGSPDWTGHWAGWACKNKQCDLKMVVISQTDDEVTFDFSAAGPLHEPFNERVTGRYVDGQVQAALSNGRTLTLKMRNSETLEALLRYPLGDVFITGVLSKTERFNPPAVPIENPFNGSWEIFGVSGTGIERDWGIRIDIDGHDGVFYPERRSKEGNGNVCHVIRAPIHDIKYSETTMEFSADRSKLVIGCEDVQAYFQSDGKELRGFGRVISSEGSVLWYGTMLAKRP